MFEFAFTVSYLSASCIIKKVYSLTLEYSCNKMDSGVALRIELLKKFSNI